MNVPWKKILATVVGGVLLMLLGGVSSHFMGYLGPEVGVAGVRIHLANHEANADVHPNVPALEQRLKGIEAAQSRLGTAAKDNQKRTDQKIGDLQQQQTDSTNAILGAIGDLKD